MKTLKRIGIGIIILPFALICLYILYELVGYAVNHISTDRQTSRLQKDLTAAVQDIDVISAESWTGNTGNGNHVECVSTVKFKSKMTKSEITEALGDNYVSDDTLLGARLNENEDGDYEFKLITAAPFSDNIEGH